jgi:perosamine synthetase
MIGAKPILVDVKEQDFNIDWDKVGDKITPKTKAILVPHIHGMPSYVPGREYSNIPIIEDCATAIGSYVKNDQGAYEHVGNKAELSITSFYATKFCAMGYGGFVLSKRKELANFVLNYREFDCVEEYQPRFNFQVSDLNAALGRSQLKKANTFLARREFIRTQYDEVFDAKGVNRQTPIVDCKYNNYRYILRLPPEEREKFSSYLLEKGIKTIIPIEQYELLHNYISISKSDFAVAEKIAQTTLSIPVYPALTDSEVDQIIKAIKSY